MSLGSPLALVAYKCFDSIPDALPVDRILKRSVQYLFLSSIFYSRYFLVVYFFQLRNVRATVTSTLTIVVFVVYDNCDGVNDADDDAFRYHNDGNNENGSDNSNDNLRSKHYVSM